MDVGALIDAIATAELKAALAAEKLQSAILEDSAARDALHDARKAFVEVRDQAVKDRVAALTRPTTPERTR